MAGCRGEALPQLHLHLHLYLYLHLHLHLQWERGRCGMGKGEHLAKHCIFKEPCFLLLRLLSASGRFRGNIHLFYSHVFPPVRKGTRLLFLNWVSMMQVPMIHEVMI